MKRSDLVQVLEGAGKPTETWESSDGTRVLVLPYGGRVLGLFAPGDEENFFWSHPALCGVKAARSFYDSAQWHNSGGDRTWVAPEVDFFLPDYPDLNRYWQQRELDPGLYVPSKNNGIIRWRNRATLTLSRTKQKIELEIAKSLAPALNPLRYDFRQQCAGLKFAGYTLCTTLQLRGTSSPPRVGQWHLTQMPHGGEMLVPTYSRSEPTMLIGAIASEDLIVSEHLVKYKMHAAGLHKLGIRAIGITGRAGYIYTVGSEVSLVVRNFSVNPSGEYADVPWHEPDNLGFAFQACNVNSDLGSFSELEYHVPAIGSQAGGSRSEDRSQLWAFRGSEQMIKSVARNLLSSEV